MTHHHKYLDCSDGWIKPEFIKFDIGRFVGELFTVGINT